VARRKWLIACGSKSEIVPDELEGSNQRSKALINEVADVRKKAFTQFHAQQLCPDRGAHVAFKAIEYRSRQIRVLTEHLQYRRAIGQVLVIAGHPACWPDRQRERNCSFARCRCNR
jgi:hypothetical protein